MRNVGWSDSVVFMLFVGLSIPCVFRSGVSVATETSATVSCSSFQSCLDAGEREFAARRLTSAIALYRSAERLAPNPERQSVAHMRLAEVFKALGDTASANYHAQKASDLSGGAVTAQAPSPAGSVPKGSTGPGESVVSAESIQRTLERGIGVQVVTPTDAPKASAARVSSSNASKGPPSGAGSARHRPSKPHTHLAAVDVEPAQPAGLASMDLRINFEFGSDQLDAQGWKQTDELGKALAGLVSQERSREFMLVGHTDSVGESRSNQQLSEQRAETVKQVLTTKYPELSGRLKTTGRGELDPRAPGEDEASRRLNRRVEIIVTR